MTLALLLALAHAAPSPGAFEERWGITLAEEDARWDGAALSAVDAALARLDPVARAAVRGVVFVRARVDADVAARSGAWRRPRDDVVAELRLYDRAFPPWAVDPDGRVPIATVLHEVGHALVDLPCRVLDGEARAAACHRSPVLEAYTALPGALAGPTPYGRTSPHESFAEAFALWHVAPEAYRRAAPEAAAWFDGGGHVAAVRAALEA